VPVSTLSEVFASDPDSGRLFWRDRPPEHFLTAQAHSIFQSRFAGLEAGLSVDMSGRRKCAFRLLGRRYAVFRSWVVWALANGVWPTQELHHRNDVVDDDRLPNLVEITSAQRRMLTPSQKPVGRGVILRPSGRYHAYIRPGGHSIHLGAFASAEEARTAFQKAAQEHFGPLLVGLEFRP